MFYCFSLAFVFLVLLNEVLIFPIKELSGDLFVDVGIILRTVVLLEANRNREEAAF